MSLGSAVLSCIFMWSIAIYPFVSFSFNLERVSLLLLLALRISGESLLQDLKYLLEWPLHLAQLNVVLDLVCGLRKLEVSEEVVVLDVLEQLHRLDLLLKTCCSLFIALSYGVVEVCLGNSICLLVADDGV